MGTSTIRLRSIKSSLPSLYPLRHSRDKIFQALYRFSVLQATKSWAGPGNEAKVYQRHVEYLLQRNNPVLGSVLAYFSSLLTRDSIVKTSSHLPQVVQSGQTQMAARTVAGCPRGYHRMHVDLCLYSSGTD